MAKKALKKSTASTPARAAKPARKKAVAAAGPARTAAPARPTKTAVSAVVSRAAKPAVATRAGRRGEQRNERVAKSSVANVALSKVKPIGRRPDRAIGSKEPHNPMPVLIPRPIPTDGKPRKNQAGLHTRDLEHFRELLFAKRRELVGDMSSMEREALRSTTGTNLSSLPLHMADMGTDNYEQEFTLGLVEKDRQLLREINRALAKIMDGSYGICEGTGKPIARPRLEAQPWARHSIEYARQVERGMIRR